MSKFWDWYDALEPERGAFRFALFMFAILALYLVIPGIIGLIWGRDYFQIASFVGIVVMSVLAFTKHFRWPK